MDVPSVGVAENTAGLWAARPPWAKLRLKGPSQHEAQSVTLEEPRRRAPVETRPNSKGGPCVRVFCGSWETPPGPPFAHKTACYFPRVLREWTEQWVSSVPSPGRQCKSGPNEGFRGQRGVWGGVLPVALFLWLSRGLGPRPPESSLVARVQRWSFSHFMDALRRRRREGGLWGTRQRPGVGELPPQQGPQGSGGPCGYSWGARGGQSTAKVTPPPHTHTFQMLGWGGLVGLLVLGATSRALLLIFSMCHIIPSRFSP